MRTPLKLAPLLMTALIVVALTGVSAAEAAPASSDSAKQSITLNGFRGPSIGLEYRKGTWSWHAGFYPTVLSMDDARERKTTWFTRGGLTWWPTHLGLVNLFVDASTLMGLNLGYRNDFAYMLNPGMQYRFYDVVLRLGVAALWAPGHDVKINPTPGIGLSFPVSL